MAVNYKMYQDNRKESKTKGKWFARATHSGVVETKQLAAIIERNSSMKQSDVQAVLIELTEVMTDMLQNSMRVKINGLGSFKIGISTRAADTQKEFSLAKNLRNIHVIFQPEMTVDRAGKVRCSEAWNCASTASMPTTKATRPPRPSPAASPQA